MVRIALLLLLASLAPAQVIFQATAPAGGDGSQCTGTKNANANTNFTLLCQNSYRGLPSEKHVIYNAGSLQPKVTVAQTVHFGDILCMFGVNPTNYTTNFGSLGDVPPTSLVYSCAINTRTNGVVTGNVLGPFGIVHWP